MIKKKKGNFYLIPVPSLWWHYLWLILWTRPVRVIWCFLAQRLLCGTRSKGAVVPWPTVVSLHSSDILRDTQASHCAHPLSHEELIGTNQWMAVLTGWGIRRELDLTGFAPCGLDEGQILSNRSFTTLPFRFTSPTFEVVQCLASSAWARSSSQRFWGTEAPQHSGWILSWYISFLALQSRISVFQ